MKQTRQQKRKAERDTQKPKQEKKLKGILWDGFDKNGNPIGGMK